MKKLSLVLSLLLLVLASGCSGKFASEEYVRDDVDFAAVQRVAVLPFQNFTGDQFAHERARNVAITQLLALQVADVVDRGIVDSVMTEEVIDPRQPIDIINLKRLGQRLNVQAFLLGSVDLVDSKKTGSVEYPVLAITLRLVEAQSSIVIWQSSGRWTSESVTGRIFGISPTDNFHVNIQLIRNMMRSLANK
jgi:TolB-like protein